MDALLVQVGVSLIGAGIVGLIIGMVSTHMKVKDLHDWHNIKDTEGVFVWYERTKKMEDAIERMTQVIERMDRRDERAELLQERRDEILEKHTLVVDSLVTVVKTLIVEVRAAK